MITPEIMQQLASLGTTSCKVPVALPYIEHIEKMGRSGKKKKMVRC